MKKFFLSVGALAALVSFSACDLNTNTSYSSHAIGHEIGSTEGLVWPTNDMPCPKGAVTPFAKDPPLPKNVPNATWYNSDKPPVKYQGNATVKVVFETPEQINAKENVDGKGRLECDSAVFAYSDGHTMHMPNPCKYPKSDAYARLACHELGHVNGWPGYHGDY